MFRYSTYYCLWSYIACIIGDALVCGFMCDALTLSPKPASGSWYDHAYTYELRCFPFVHVRMAAGLGLLGSPVYQVAVLQAGG